MTLSNGTSSRIVAAMTLSLALTMIAPTSARAQVSTVVTFNTLTESSPGSGTRFVGNCYVESGFLFTAIGLPCSGAAAANVFVAGSVNSPVFGGGATPSLLLNSPDASILSVVRQDGASFTFSSIALAPFDGARTTVLFTGIRAGGNVTRTFVLAANQAGFQTFNFADLFIGVNSVQIAATNEFGEPLVKLDNFSAVSSVGVVPEPASMLLFGAGAFVLLAVTYRRRTQA